MLEDDGLDFFGKDEASAINPEWVKDPRKVLKASNSDAEDEEEEEEDIFDPLGSVR